MRVIPKQAANDMAVMAGGTYGRGGDVLDHYLFDTEGFQATTVRPETRYFQKGFGGSYLGTGSKTLSETNLTDTGKLPAGQSFLAKAISLGVNLNLLEAQQTGGNNVAGQRLIALQNILRSSVFEFRFASQDFSWQAPGHVFLPSIYSNGGLQQVAAAGPVQSASGEFKHLNWISIRTPLVIGELVSFSVSMRSQNGLAALQTIMDTASNTLSAANATLTILLKGTLTRSK